MSRSAAVRSAAAAAALAVFSVAAPILSSAPVASAASVALSSPSLLSPSAGRTVKFRENVTFDWSDVSGASRYQLQVDAQPTFPQLLALNTTTVASTYQATGLSFFDPDVPTSFGTRYWRVAAVDANGVLGPWSAVRTFVIVK